MAYKLSPSSIALFKDCPRCFWLEKVKGIKRPETIFPSLPSGVDSVLKQHFDMHRAKGTIPNELDLPDVKLFDNTELLKVWRSNFKGVSITDADGNILHGAVDEILQEGDKLIVLDFKTRGFPCKEDTHEHYVDQLDIYNFLLRKSGHDTEDYSYLLFFHPKEVTEKGTIVFNIELKKMPVDIKAAEKLWGEALRCLEGKDMPKASAECGFCNWERFR